MFGIGKKTLIAIAAAAALVGGRVVMADTVTVNSVGSVFAPLTGYNTQGAFSAYIINSGGVA
ncbi:MAG TPA: hypothetical protein VMD30_02180, partial [Tepidisphaeraceae bacterium]|nr:hypothetical protein [Tepidisphaeraceae bacterium]